MTPVHGNLGDHAIAKAESIYLKKNNVDFMEIPGKYLAILSKQGLLGTMNGATIIINGGGNIGTLWPEYEDLIESIVKSNPASRIVIMPSTAYFENDGIGEKVAAGAERIFNNHKDLTIFAREEISYNILKKIHYDVKLCPDIVFSLDESLPLEPRNGCIVCLREDREKTLSQETEAIIRSTLSMYYDHIYDSKLDYFHEIKLSKRSKMLNDKFSEFRSSELVITDRMHGVVFAAITGTPCLVIKSKSHKISGTFEWVKNLGYILLLEDEDEIKNTIGTFIGVTKKRYYYDPKKMRIAFRELEAYLKTL